MKQVVHAIAYGNEDIDLMYEHVIEKFPELLITPPVSSLPEPENETNIAITMYQYMIKLLYSPRFVGIRCTLLCHKNYWSNDQNEDNISLPGAIQELKERFHCSNPFIIDITRQLIDKFILKFPYLLITPDKKTDIPLSNAILQDQPAATLRWLGLAKQAGMEQQVLNYQNNDGNTPLMFMAFSKCGKDVLEKMLQLGAAKTVLMQDKDKRTVVHYCIIKRKQKKINCNIATCFKKFWRESEGNHMPITQTRGS